MTATALNLARAPFAFTISFDFIFPAFIVAALSGTPSPVHAAAPPALESADGMVVTAQHLASDVGAAILRQGGNAVDAAVAVGYALAVTHPCCGNLGGGGFMTIHLADGRNTFINPPGTLLWGERLASPRGVRSGALAAARVNCQPQKTTRKGTPVIKVSVL
jgi:hypothetical protein